MLKRALNIALPSLFCSFHLISSAPAWASWARTFPPQASINALIPTPDGGSVVSSTLDVSGNGKATLMKLDAAGQPEWLKYIEYPGNPAVETSITSGVRLLGGDYLFGVRTFGIPTPPSFLILIDQTTWTPTWIKLMSGGVGGLRATSDGGFLTGFSKYMADGSPVWSKYFDPVAAGLTYLGVNDIKERPGGIDPGFILVGTVSPCPPPNNSPDGCAFVANLDINGGSISWAKFYPELYEFTSVSVTTNRELYVAGRQRDPVPSAFHPWVGRLAENGSLLWERWYRNGFDHEGGLIAETSTGTVVSLSLYANSGGPFTFVRILALGHDASGTLLWQRQYQPDTFTYWDIPIVPVAGGDFFIGGLSYPAAVGPLTAWAMRLDPLGQIGTSCSVVTPGNAFEVNGITTPTIFPNFPSPLDFPSAPVRGVLNIVDGVPTSNLVCSGGCAAPPSVVTLLKGIRSETDAIFSWMTEPSANGYNLWHVTSKDQIDLARQTSVPPAMPVTGCTPITGTTCTDSGAVPRSSPATFFYQVRAYCDPATEGP